MPGKEKVCLAYSGGLDTSCILAWLLEKGYSVVCFLADVGQQEDFKEAERKALKIGAEKLVVDDLKKEFVEDLCFRAIQCNVSGLLCDSASKLILRSNLPSWQLCFM